MAHKTKIATLTIGCTLAVAILCSQFFHYQVNASLKKETATEQHQETPSNAKESLSSLPSFSLPSPVTVQANLDSYCLFEILFDSPKLAGNYTEIPTFQKKLFITLFSVIISPNAP